jgi:hypothetical protein
MPANGIGFSSVGVGFNIYIGTGPFVIPAPTNSGSSTVYSIASSLTQSVSITQAQGSTSARLGIIGTTSCAGTVTATQDGTSVSIYMEIKSFSFGIPFLNVTFSNIS